MKKEQTVPAAAANETRLVNHKSVLKESDLE